MWIVCLADNSHELPSLIFSENKKKIEMSPAAVVIIALSIKFKKKKKKIHPI